MISSRYLYLSSLKKWHCFQHHQLIPSILSDYNTVLCLLLKIPYRAHSVLFVICICHLYLFGLFSSWTRFPASIHCLFQCSCASAFSSDSVSGVFSLPRVFAGSRLVLWPLLQRRGRPPSDRDRQRRHWGGAVLRWPLHPGHLQRRTRPVYRFRANFLPGPVKLALTTKLDSLWQDVFVPVLEVAGRIFNSHQAHEYFTGEWSVKLFSIKVVQEW